MPKNVNNIAICRIVILALLALLLVGCSDSPLEPKPNEERLMVEADGRSGAFAHWLVGWVGFQGWYVVPGDAAPRSGTLRFERSAVSSDQAAVGFQVRQFVDGTGTPVETLPAGTIIHYRMLVTDTFHSDVGSHSDVCEWTWTDGVLRRVE